MKPQKVLLLYCRRENWGWARGGGHKPGMIVMIVIITIITVVIITMAPPHPCVHINHSEKLAQSRPKASQPASKTYMPVQGEVRKEDFRRTSGGLPGDFRLHFGWIGTRGGPPKDFRATFVAKKVLVHQTVRFSELDCWWGGDRKGSLKDVCYELL